MHKVIFTQPIDRFDASAPNPKAPPVKERLRVPHERLPEWIRIRPKSGPNFQRVWDILKDEGLHSVCQEAACPNIRECWDEGTATFMILGKHCTRGCNFCDVLKKLPEGLDLEEPKRLADAVARLNLKQVVITSVTRDDLPDGGASIFARTIELLRWQDKQVKIEVLVPDFAGNTEAMTTVLDSGVDVMAHNVETVARLHKRVRGAAKLDRSLEMLRFASTYSPRPVIKTGIMVGLGEIKDELVELMYQCRAAGVDIITIGQYLRPSLAHLPVERFYHPDEFAELARVGMDEVGLGHVEAGPLVRSSYKAFNQSKRLLEMT
jgi:lipoic acid synthetase